MNNTTWFGLTDNNILVKLGEGADTKDVADILADNAESVTGANGKTTLIVAVLNINDLYRLRAAATEALNNLDNEILSGESITFGTEIDFTD